MWQNLRWFCQDPGSDFAARSVSCAFLPFGGPEQSGSSQGQYRIIAELMILMMCCSGEEIGRNFAFVEEVWFGRA